VRHIRLIIDEGPAEYNMALDEAMLILRGAGIIGDTLRLYVFNPPAVTIGYFQSVSKSVDLSFTKENNIAVVRRPTGGGAVYHDTSGEITYAIVVSAESVPEDLVESFKFLAGGVVEAARILGAPAEFRPLNDIVIGGRKFSGQAQLRRLGAVLQHGTFMHGTNLDVLAKSLIVPNIKLKEKSISSIRERVTTISEYLGRKVSKREAIEALIKGFEKALNAELVEGELSELELILAKSLEWKYGSKNWTCMRP